MKPQQDVEGTSAFGNRVDFGKTASDYRQFRAGFPDQFFQRLAANDWIGEGQHGLDLGTGTGTVGRGRQLLGTQGRSHRRWRPDRHRSF